jgi:hypothetical protein
MDTPLANNQVSTQNATTLKPGYGVGKKKKLKLIKDFVNHARSEGESAKHERTESKREKKREGEY